MSRDKLITPEAYCAAFETWLHVGMQAHRMRRLDDDEAGLWADVIRLGCKYVRRTFNAPVEANVICHSLHIWLKGVRDGMRAMGSEDKAQMVAGLVTAVEHSNLLARLIYGQEPLRTVMCPKHKGKWSGCNFSKEPCACQCGADVTGWLPLPASGATK